MGSGFVFRGEADSTKYNADSAIVMHLCESYNSHIIGESEGRI